ncbi:MAG TPA: hypothetical protein VFA45_03370 [Actinomycetes bacterium]|jgi:hypothetical protein|nr:hypothetical protein [Actinomycetes bacterium]
MCSDGWGTIEEIAIHGWLSRITDINAFNEWARRAYHLTDDSWDPAGAGDANDATLPFGKVLSGIALICYGLRDAPGQWHSSEDYTSSTRAANNRFHGPFTMRFIQHNGTSEASAGTGLFLTRDRTDLHCRLFDVGSISNFPCHRAAVLVHESWHHWQYRRGFSTHHSAACPAGDCDTYHFHGVGAFQFGELDLWSVAGAGEAWHLTRFHAPYQIEAEFFADLAEFSKPSVPEVVAKTARAHGNILLNRHFINEPGYRIGNPRPF